MSGERPRVRFAPSPTGDLHVGNARTALFNWLFARHCGGLFVLRLEDTDRERSSEAFAAALLADLRWLGLAWDEGPEVGGPFGPYRQMERLEHYRTHLERLRAAGHVYPCYCTEAELAAEREGQLARGLAPRYGGRCRRLTEEERRRREGEGRKPAMRFRVPDREVAFTDLIRGPKHFPAGAVGDFIIVRAAGIPAYNFAVVVDDHAMAVTHVIRGEDHLSNTARQLLLYEALGFAPPRFAHHALILGRDREKLSKRHGAVSVRQFRAQGILPEALLNYLALLGSSFAGAREVLTAAEMVAEFSIGRAGRSGAVFDEGKLRWINTAHLRRLDTEELCRRLLAFDDRAGCGSEARDPAWLRRCIDTARDNAATLADLAAYVRMFSPGGEEPSPEAREVLRGPEAREVLLAFDAGLATGAGCKEAVRDAARRTGLVGRRLFFPLRAALTGALHGPELDAVFALLGEAAVRERVERALRLAEAGAPPE
jgi:nondiscriminating glutamyl-tRNA synthetase